jgi:hypothetical protein
MRNELTFIKKHAFAATIVIMIIMVPLISADAEEYSSKYSNHSLLKDSWSFQFAITEEFSLASFKGTMVSAKRHISDQSALRFGIGIYAMNQNNEYYCPPDYFGRSDRDYNSLGIKFGLQYLFYKHSQSRLKSYIGIGPTISFIYNEYLTRDSENSEHVSQSYYSHKLIVGLRGNWGVEWFISNSISLIAEYGAAIEFSNRFAETEGWSYLPAPEEYAIDELRFHATPVNFGLSVYF